MKKRSFFFIFLGLFFLKISSQNAINFDSIRKHYEERRLQRDFKKAKSYGFKFLDKAKKEKDTTRIAEGYYLLANVFYRDTSFVYADSAISITKNKPDFWEPARSYIFKANSYAIHGNYKDAFEAIDLANAYTNRNANNDQKFEIQYILSRLYTKIGDYNASITSIKDILKRYSKPSPDCENCVNRAQVILLWAYANNLNLLKKTDGIEDIYKTAFSLSLKTPDSVVYSKLLLASAITKFQKKDYQASLDSITKLETVTRIFNPSSDLLRHLYKGKIYLHLNQNELALDYFKKSDSIAEAKNYFHPSIRENYEILVHYYKDRKDLKNQLVYINKLLKTDSVIRENYSYLTKNIAKKYTTPKLLSEKQKVIDALNNAHSSKNLVISILAVIVILISLILYLNNKKRRIYKQRVKTLGDSKKTPEYTIDDETTQRILNQLSKIEQSELFLNKDFTLSFLAKKLDTNTSYLSKIINTYKGKPFKQYLIELRIKTLIRQLDENPVMRKYSIEALAESVGYTNASSFTRIFKNYLGETPSAFLKKRYAKVSDS